MSDIQRLQSTLWEMANKLRGSMDASEYKNYILAFIFYRYLSEKQMNYLVDQDLITPEKGETANQAFITDVSSENDWSDYEEDLTQTLGYAIKPENTWESLVDKINNGEVIASDYQEIFDSFNESTKMNKDAEKDFRGIFSDVNLGDSRLGTTTTDRAKALGRIVDLVNSIEYRDDTGKDVLGTIYEYLIGQFAANAGKKGGEFYTPHEVSLIMARIVTGSYQGKSPFFTVFDPACGSGSLLLTVGNALKELGKKQAVKYYGQELNTTTYNLARMNLMMHDVAYQDMTLRNADTLGPDWPDGPNSQGIDEPRQFDAVVANPPYSAKWSADESLIKDPRFTDFGRLAPKSKADFAFLLDGFYHLGDQGTMAIVLPHGVLFRGAAEYKIRETLVNRNYLDAIIGLPTNLFYGTSIPTIILVLKRNKPDKSVLFIDASQEFKKGKNKNVLTSENIDKIVETYFDRKDIDKYSRLVSYKEIKENDFNLNIPRYVDTSEEEKEIDLHSVLENIRKDDDEISKLRIQLNIQLRLLGVLRDGEIGL